jgi:hypothetical protein
MTGLVLWSRKAWSMGFPAPRLIGWLALAWILPLAAVGADDPRSADQKPAPLEFRRVFVVDEALSKLALDGWYLPVKREDFEQLIRSAAVEAEGAEAALQSRVVRATYTARLTGNQRLEGEAQLEIVHRGGREAPLVLEPCNLVIKDTRWRSAELSDAPGEASDLTVQPRRGFDEHGRFTVMVSESGTLDLTWALRSLPDATDLPSFVLRLPECPLTQVFLELPNDLQPTANQGFLTRDTGVDEAPLRNRWVWDVGGHSRLYLRLVRFPDSGPSPRKMEIRQQSQYRFTPHDMDLTIDLHLDILNEPLPQLALAVDPALRVVQVTHAGQPLRWTKHRSDQGLALLLEMPEPLIGLDHRIRLQALAPIELGRIWPLPMVRVEQNLCSHATVQLELPEALVLQELATQGARQTDTRATGPGGGEAVTIECFDPQAEIAVVLDAPPGHIQVRRGTTVTLGRNRTSLVDSAQFTTDGPPRFELTLAVPWRWNVDQIESQPPEALEEWSFAGRAGSSRLLQIRLREPLAPNRPLSLNVAAHSDGLRSGARLTGETLRLGEYLGTSTTMGLFSLNAEPPWQVRLDGDGQLQRLDTDERQLVDVSSGSILFRDGPGMEQMTVDLRSEPPDYAVRIDMQCEADERKLDLTYRIQVQPQASPIDRLQIHFTGTPGQRMDWTYRGAGLQTAKRLPTDAVKGQGGGDIWQITLPEPTDASFEVHARQTVEFDGEAWLPLAAVPGAASQVGTVTIRSPEAVPLQFTAQNVRAIPAKPLAAGRSSTTRAVYRYDPSQDCRISVRHSPEAIAAATAWVWSCDLVTRHYRDGTTLHVAEYRVEGVGAGQMILTAPEPVEWLSARIDGREVPLALEDAHVAQVKIPLPRDARFPTVQVRYVTRGKPLRAFGEIAAVWPDCDQRVFRRNWVAWLPPGLASHPGSASPPTEPWLRRLLGSLLRPADVRPFAPWSAGDWTALWRVSHEPALPPGWQTSAKWLQELSIEYQRLLDSATEQSPITWGELLRVWQREDNAEDSPLADVWIDQLALGTEGLWAQSLVRAPTAPRDGRLDTDSGTAQGVSLLTAAGLALLIDGNRLRVTTVRGLFDRTDVIHLPGLPHVFGLPHDDPELEDLQPPNNLRWIRLEQWIEQPPLPQACWQHTGIPSLHRSDEISGNSGWTAQRISAAFPGELSDSLGRTRLTVYQPLVIRSLGWAALLAAMGLTVWMVRGRLPLAWPLAGLAGIVTLLSPALWTPVFQGVFVGTLLGGLLALVRAARAGHGPALPKRQEMTTTSLFIRTLAWGAWSIALAGQASAADSGDSGTPRTAAAAPVYQVLSPIDAQGDPQGEYVYLPADFYEALLQQTSPSAGPTLPWMIYDAQYQATMNWNATEERLSVVELSVTYDLEVFRPGTAVRLPIVESQAHLLPHRALLDGRPVTVRWLENGRGLALDIDSAGRYRIALALRPHVLRNGDFDRFEIAIPRVANSRLRVHLPSDITGLAFPTALGASIPDLGAGNWLVELGPTERLVARWPNNGQRASLREVLELDQLMWLRVRPDVVQLDARLRFSQFFGPITRVELIADHRLRLLPPADDSLIAWYESTRGANQIIHLEFKPPHRQELEIDLSFVLDQTASTGTIRLPSLTSSADRLLRSWLGVSIDPGLAIQSGQPEGESSLPPVDFLNAWEPLASAPQWVIDLDSPSHPTSLLIHPRETEVTAQQRTEVVCRPDAAELLLAADLKVVHGTKWQYEIDLPDSVAVERVSVEQAGQSSLRSWSRGARGALIVRLDQAASQDHQLKIHGRLVVANPSQAETPGEIPDWRIAGVVRQSHSVDVYRHEQVQIQVVESEGYAVDDEFVEGRFSPGRGRWVASLIRQPDAAQPQLKLRTLRNRPTTTGHLVTAVRRESDGWWAEVDLHLKITGGVLDVLRLEIPSDWKGPFQVPEGMTAGISDLPGKGRYHLELRLDQAAMGDFHVQVRGPVSSASRERIRVPDLVLLDAERIENFVLLPTRIDQQRVVWERSGLQAQPLPEPLRSLRGPADLPYAALRPRFQATIKDIQSESGLASVRLADHALELDASGRILGVSTFDLEPAGRNECRLILPEGYQLLYATVANLPVSLLPVEQHQLRVPLGSQQLPQRIQVLFTGRISNGSHQLPTQSLHSPMLQGLTVEQTAWTIRYPAGARWQWVPTGSMTTPDELDWLRVRSLADLIGRAKEVLKDGDPEEIERWYVPWTRRWVTARSRLQPALSHSAESDGQAKKELAEFDEEHRRTAERLGVQAGALLAEHEARHAFEINDVWRMVADPHLVATTLITSSPSELPQVRRVEPPRPAGTSNLAALSMLAGLTLLAMLLLPHPVLDDLLRRHPEILGILLGAVWWWAFAASAAGLLVCCASLILFLYRIARRRSRRLAITVRGTGLASQPGT